MSAVLIPTSIIAEPVDRLDPADMRELLRSFTQTTRALEATHSALHEQVARLQQELADANAALRRSESLAALGQMAAGIAHEVRNPLGSIQLYAQMLGEDLADRPEQAEICGKINGAVVGLDAIVRDVLTFARDMKIRPEPIGTHELIDRALAACDGLVAAHHIRIRRESAKTQSLLIDAGLVTQALSNLIRNAIEAMVEHESSTRELSFDVSVRRVAGTDRTIRPCVVISVRDSGPGIPVEVQDRIFNPFFTTRHTGTGLGLAIVHRIIDAHSGRVTILNNPDGGACVELSLPAPAPQAGRRSKQHDFCPKEHSHGQLTVTIPPRRFSERAR